MITKHQYEQILDKVRLLRKNKQVVYFIDFDCKNRDINGVPIGSGVIILDSDEILSYKDFIERKYTAHQMEERFFVKTFLSKLKSGLYLNFEDFEENE